MGTNGPLHVPSLENKEKLREKIFELMTECVEDAIAIHGRCGGNDQGVDLAYPTLAVALFNVRLGSQQPMYIVKTGE